MVDISSGDKKINITVSTSGNKASVNASPDTAMYYSNKSREWAISDKIIDGEDYSSKYYANTSKQNADKSTVNLENLTTNYNQYKNELENTKNISVEEIGTAKTNAISDITNQETLSVDNVNTAGATQVNLAKEQATIATTQAGIATAKTSEVVESGNNALTAITEQETTSKNNIIAKGAEQIELIQNEGATQIANVQSTGFYMRDDKLYYINSQGEETEFKSGGLPIGTIIPVNATSNYVPNGSLPCDGAEYSKSQFTDLWNNYLSTSLLNTCTYTEYASDLSTYGQCAKFAVDTVNNKFRVPFIKDGAVIQQALTNSELGKSYNAGLPNITGTFCIDKTSADWGKTSVSGVFYNAGLSADGNKATQSMKAPQIGFDASLSNPIYGNSTTVQPNAVALRYFVVVANGQINQSMMDWSAWASSLQGKANTDLSNLSNSGKKVIDGQWVSKHSLANTNATKGLYNIDLSEYLPDNLYWYEINASVNIYTSSSSDTNGYTEIANYLTNSYVGYDSAGDSRNYFYLHIEYDQYNENASDTFTMIIPPDRQIIMKAIWGENSKINELHLISYRRLGTNV